MCISATCHKTIIPLFGWFYVADTKNEDIFMYECISVNSFLMVKYEIKWNKIKYEEK